jgi:hypothetical protein
MSAASRRVRVPLVTLLLGACILALGSGWVMQLWSGSQRAALLAVPAKPLRVAEQRFDRPVLAGAGELQSQAVFHPSRSFYSAPAPLPQEQAPPDYRLAAVMRVPNQPVVAILINNQSKVRARVQSGDVLEQWVVAEIQPGKVLLALAGQRAEITAKSSAPISVNADSAPAMSQASKGLTLVAKGQPGSAPPPQ